MTDDMGVDAVRHNNGRSQFVLAQRPAETDDVEPVAHARAPDVDPTESQLLEERTLVNQRQNRDVVASVAKRRNELRPLPLGAPDIQTGANEQNLVAYHGCDGRVTSPSTARPGLSRLHRCAAGSVRHRMDRIYSPDHAVAVVPRPNSSSCHHPVNRGDHRGDRPESLRG